MIPALQQLLVQLDGQLPQAQIEQSLAELSLPRPARSAARSWGRKFHQPALARATAAHLTLVAPFSGIAGVRQINVGNYLEDGSAVLLIFPAIKQELSPMKDRSVILANGNAPDGLTLEFANHYAQALERFRCPAW